MPYRELMGYKKETGQWFKKAPDGSVKFVGFRTLNKLYPHLVTSKTREGTREAANVWWEAFLAQLGPDPVHQEYNRTLAGLAVMRRALDLGGDATEFLDRAASELNRELEKKRPKRVEEAISPDSAVALTSFAHDMGQGFEPILQDRIRIAERLGGKVQLEFTSKALVDQWFARFKGRANSGELSIGRAENDYVMRPWLEFAGDTYDMRTMNALKFESYRTWLGQQIEAKRWSRAYVRDFWTYFKSFVKWCAQLDVCPLPKNLDDRSLAVRKVASAVETFTDNEIATIFAKAEGMVRLYALLAANCAMTQKDIGELEQKQVDLENGYLTRKRVKGLNSAKADSFPTVRYKLWPETITLLKQYRSDHPKLFLLNETGTPLYRFVPGEKKQQKIDNVSSAWKRFASKNKVPQAFARFRATGNTALVNSGRYAMWGTFWLADSDTTTAGIYYTGEVNFDEAVDWLRQHFLKPERPRRARKKR